MLTIQTALEAREDVNQIAAEARALWDRLRTEILPERLDVVENYEVEDWNRATEALWAAFSVC